MTDDLVKHLRDSRFDGQLAMRSSAADRIEYLERELGEERHSREIASAKGWEFSDRIKELEKILRRAVDGYDKAYCRDEVDFDWVDDAKAALGLENEQ